MAHLVFVAFFNKKLFFIGEPTMSTDDETVIKQDTLLFKLMMHNYDEEVRRNELIDSKNSQMIAFLGIMFTIQLTLFVNVLSTYLSKNVWPMPLKISFLSNVF